MNYFTLFLAKFLSNFALDSDSFPLREPEPDLVYWNRIHNTDSPSRTSIPVLPNFMDMLIKRMDKSWLLDNMVFLMKGCALVLLVHRKLLYPSPPSTFNTKKHSSVEEKTGRISTKRRSKFYWCVTLIEKPSFEVTMGKTSLLKPRWAFLSYNLQFTWFLLCL